MARLDEFNKPLSVICGENVELSAPGGAIICAVVPEKQLGAVLLLNNADKAAIEPLFLRLIKVNAAANIQPGEVLLKMLGDPAILNTVSALAESYEIQVVGQTGLKVPHLAGVFNAESGKLRIQAGKPKPVDPSSRIKVLIVDDSNTIRKLLRNIFTESEGFEVVADIENPLEAETAIERLKPDVCTLDIHMPQMDGITLLKKITSRFQTPCVMLSTISKEEGVHALGAFEHGAIDYIEKPSFDQFESQAPMLREKIRAAKNARVQKAPAKPISFSPSGAIQQDLPIVIGSSTGGTEALRVLLGALPANIPPILIVQHIPAVFSLALAQRLTQLCQFPVHEATDGQAIQAGHAYIAPGGLQMHLQGKGMDSRIVLSKEPSGLLHCPSVDVLFESARKSFGKDCIAVILTGMGSDGAKGLLELRKLGAKTIGQDEKSSVVYGMPKKAFDLGAVETQLPLEKIPEKLCSLLSRMKQAA